MMKEPNDGRPDEFEARLGRTPLKSLPTEWRSEIISRAQSETAGKRPEAPRPAARPPSPSRGRSWAEHLLRLPLGWAGLAAVWAFVFFAGNVDRWLNGGSSRALVKISMTQFVHAQVERDQLLRLADRADRDPDLGTPAARRPLRDAVPPPRSDRRRERHDPFEAGTSETLHAWWV